jgi:hypothetical protein
MAGVREPLRGSRKARVRPPRRTQTWRANAHHARHSIASQRGGRALRARADELLWISAPGARLREDEKWGGERSCCRSASRSRSPSTDRPGAVACVTVRAIRLRDARTPPHDLHSPCVRPRGGLRGPSPKGGGRLHDTGGRAHIRPGECTGARTPRRRAQALVGCADSAGRRTQLRRGTLKTERLKEAAW